MTAIILLYRYIKSRHPATVYKEGNVTVLPKQSKHSRPSYMKCFKTLKLQLNQCFSRPANSDVVVLPTLKCKKYRCLCSRTLLPSGRKLTKVARVATTSMTNSMTSTDVSEISTHSKRSSRDFSSGTPWREGNSWCSGPKIQKHRKRAANRKIVIDLQRCSTSSEICTSSPVKRKKVTGRQWCLQNFLLQLSQFVGVHVCISVLVCGDLF